ncbi:MAG TPA: hypothetical protein VLC98_15685 [Phnomibacter sp.]|nr:hypothetical protein [Phnomibacter sp.]
MKKFLLALCILFCFSYAQCLKDKLYDDGLDDSGLPHITQEGKNTLGFMLNREPWVPKGNNGSGKLSVDVDFGFKNGIFNLAGSRQVNGVLEQFTIGISDSLNFIKPVYTFNVFPNSSLGVSYTNDTCDYFNKDFSTTATGILTITKLDKANGIISGIFSANLSKPGCAPVSITDGRFDMKY